MKTSRNMAKATVTTLVLLMTSIALMTAPPVEAQLAAQQPIPGPLPAGVTANVTLETQASLSFRPQPVGLGQPFLVNMWMNPPLHVTRQFIQSFQVTITKPDGTQDVVKKDSYPADGTSWFEYTADQVGTWKLKFDFLGQYFPAGRYLNGKIVANTSGTLLGSAYYLPSSDGPYELTVQQDLVGSWPPAALPTDYWTRPVQPTNREWWPILGNFPPTGVVGGGPDWPAKTNLYNNYNTAYQNDFFVPYVKGPETGHVVWKREFAIGGIVGGVRGPQTNWRGPSMIYGHPTIIYAGKCYEIVTKPFDGITQNVWQCYDLRTGQINWERTGVSEPTFIIYETGTAAVAGAQEQEFTTYLGYIGGGRLIKYDPLTGGVVVNASIAPLSTGTFYADPYVLTVQDLGASAGSNRYRLIKWTAAGTLANLTVGTQTRIISNVSFPFSSLGNAADFEAGIAYTTTATVPAATQVAIDANVLAASLETGQLLWNVSSGLDYALFSSRTAVADHGKFAVRFLDGYWHCWDGRTGRKLWQGELSSHPWGTWGTYSIQTYGGMIISFGYDAVVAYDWDTGKIVWRYVAEAPYPYESPFTGTNGETVYAWHSAGVIADGKLYTFNSEHSPEQPIRRGWKFHCINVTTGEGIWNITAAQTGFGDGSRVFQGAIADGYVAISNAYDGYMYVFGKGKSATTISAPQVAIPKGQSLMLTGTVMDTSPGQPNTPCVSKESMSAWMEYLHMQQPIPPDVTGVPVSLDAVDPNGNAMHIATVATDMSGSFKKLWTPDLLGEYTVTATFVGDDSYGSSWAETAVGVVQAAATPETPEIPTPVDNTMTIIGSAVAVIIAFAIGIAIAVLLLRKR